MHSLTKEEINLLRHNARSVVRELGLLNDAYFDIGVTLAERHLLIELSSSLYPTIGEIAERLLLDKSTASRLIAKAVKKGYVNYSSDKNDKRKRYLHLTEQGSKTLRAFESIAFNQTKGALLTLSEEEIEVVYRGVALYAKGLKNSRLRSKAIIEKMTGQNQAELAHLLSDTHKGALNHTVASELSSLFKTYQQKGFSYFVMKMESKIIGGVGITPRLSNKQPDQRLNCELEKICLQSDMQGYGFEKALIDFSIKQAKKLGYECCYVDTAKETLFSSDLFQELGFQFIKKNKQKTSLLWKTC